MYTSLSRSIYRGQRSGGGGEEGRRGVEKEGIEGMKECRRGGEGEGGRGGRREGDEGRKGGGK